ncbi:hypothetical protein DL766_000016 [Monosporascus sp. MC13-8B]|uniref:U-box domain-containing protein n=1 Tax=Monosporascus cannonballus TaxID=155416 RepID=A0ABY0HN05_9PEZI|nr:hypothetical protein DL762_000385 [Monosporascus cannonballus]RYP01211.1 hypothetical protein DL763_000336 [Monosporascus cannonballus]RYP40215.1 hypothetical protein DL766_000016 [Monosporascus sp. MC13-8B]
MARDPTKSALLKEEGNSHFKREDYIGAESLYSKAIIADDTNPALYTNRAMARLKLEMWDSAISDCMNCLKLSADKNMKAYYILSQAQVQLGDYEAALESALNAHRLCAETNDRSLPNVTAQVLLCKQKRWEEREKRRIRQGQELERETIALMERERDEVLKSCETGIDRKAVQEEWEQKIEQLRATFEKARPESEKKRTVPDWAIDDISFCIMVDPVITLTGKSYERASIMEHLRRHPTDPLTRQPLRVSDLRPNLDLKQACEEFLEQNGWAVDW